MLGEFFGIAADEDVVAYIEDGPWERTQTVEAKTLTEISIGSLADLLGVRHEIGEGHVVGEGDEYGAFPLPDAFRDAVAAGVPDDVVAQSAATEELQMDEWTGAEARETVTELEALSRAARDDGRSLWFYWSL